MIHEVVNVELCELFDMEPKVQCKVCLSYWDVGIVYCMCGHFLRNGTEKKKKLSSTLWIPSRFRIIIFRKGDSTGTVMGRSQVITSTSSRTRSRMREGFLGLSTTGFIRDEKFRKNMFDVGRSEELCCEMDKLANEDHTHHITAEEISVYRNNWWLRSNTVGSDTMPVRHRADFKQALSTLRHLKHHGKFFLILVELARILVAFFL